MAIYRLLIATIVSLVVGIASAHSIIEQTYPKDASVIQQSPQEIGMDFDQPLRVTLVRLIDQKGSEFTLQRSDNREPVTEFRAMAPILDPGVYEVEWRGLADDGHPMQGSFTFQIKG